MSRLTARVTTDGPPGRCASAAAAAAAAWDTLDAVVRCRCLLRARRISADSEDARTNRCVHMRAVYCPNGLDRCIACSGTGPTQRPTVPSHFQLGTVHVGARASNATRVLHATCTRHATCTSHAMYASCAMCRTVSPDALTLATFLRAKWWRIASLTRGRNNAATTHTAAQRHVSRGQPRHPRVRARRHVRWGR